MRLDLARLLGPLVALLIFVLILQQTVGALVASGVWTSRHASASGTTPYARLELLLVGKADSSGGQAPNRDPFALGRAPVTTAMERRTPSFPAGPPAPRPRPTLTSIIWSDAGPSATIRWMGRDYPVEINTLFDEFRVRSITRNQVTLERGDEVLVLSLPTKGD